MIIALDHLARAVPDFDAAIASMEADGYRAKFIVRDVPNPQIKRPFLNRWSDTHSLALFVREGGLPVEILSYDHAPCGHSALHVMPEAEPTRIYQHTADPEQTVSFWRRFGFQPRQTDEGRILLRWQSSLSAIICAIELRQAPEPVEGKLDSLGINSLAFLSSNAKQERERLIGEGCRVTEVESLMVNGKKLELFFAIGTQGEICEVFSPSPTKDSH
ncbi:hypothetical protein EDM68_05350 [Candidatus Uhrbacteria bacterium]|nr:MAG: hypothetical protein EDM68_05350 [Candidatus Uhrbacteria bacterium]